jgi:magnesium transporter
MLYLNSGTSPRQVIAAEPHAPEEAEREAVWLDLFNPTDEERSIVERATGLRVPAQADLAEIESSSRLSTEGEAIYLSTPMTYRTPDGVSHTAPLGFVLTRKHLLTVRFAPLPVFDSFAEHFAAGTRATSVGAFLGLIEAIVDRLADVLEHVGADLDGISRRVFRADRDKERNSQRVDAQLRATLRAVGRSGERLSNIRDSLVGTQRIVIYTHDTGESWIPRETLLRFRTIRQDVASLMDYDVQLGNKVQFLLDATLGFINIEQNNGIKILTVVSVVGVPPTLIASIYGMNFKWIPELQWEYGYFYGLALILASAVLPLLWFKRRGWI